MHIPIVCQFIPNKLTITKFYILLLFCFPFFTFGQILTITDDSSISISETSSLSVGGLDLAPDVAYTIDGSNDIFRTSTPATFNSNSSIDRVFDTSFALNNFIGTITFQYLETELNGTPEADLILETETDEGVWTSHPAAINESDNTLTYTFDTPLEFKRITASSVNSSLTIELVVGIDAIKIYPNPTTDILYIVSNSPQRSVLFNVNNQKVLESSSKQLNVSGLPSGVYILYTTNNQNQLSTFKIIKK